GRWRGRGRWWVVGWWRSFGVVLLIPSGQVLEGFALVEDAQGEFAEEGLVASLAGGADLPFGERFEHPEAFDPDAGLQEALDEAGDGEIAGGVAELFTFPGGADQSLFLQLAQDPLFHPDGDRQTGAGHETLFGR